MKIALARHRLVDDRIADFQDFFRVEMNHVVDVIRQMPIRILADMVRVRRIEFDSHSRKGGQDDIPRFGADDAVDPVAVVKAEADFFFGRVIHDGLIDLNDVFELRAQVVALPVSAAGHDDGAVNFRREVDCVFKAPNRRFSRPGICADELLAPAADGGRVD